MTPGRFVVEDAAPSAAGRGERGMDLKQLETIAARELRTHGLHDWTFGLADTNRRLGACKYRTKRIEIAEYYARNSPADVVLDTLMHEIAHALAGPAANHGPAWKAIAVRLGATPRACDRSQQAVLKPGDWSASCPSCKKTYQFYRRPQHLSGYRCRCEARSPLTFEFTGDPARRPVVPLTRQESAKWEATCAGCGTVHLRLRRPKAGVWRCKCPHRCELAWRFRSRGSAQP
jgi:predicted SprT family Zn-dependent metalloprotease